MVCRTFLSVTQLKLDGWCGAPPKCKAQCAPALVVLDSGCYCSQQKHRIHSTGGKTAISAGESATHYWLCPRKFKDNRQSSKDISLTRTSQLIIFSDSVIKVQVQASDVWATRRHLLSLHSPFPQPTSSARCDSIVYFHGYGFLPSSACKLSSIFSEHSVSGGSQ